MTTRSQRLLAAAALVGLVTFGCNKTQTVPTPVLKTETKTGTVNPAGLDAKGFNVDYAFSGTDGVITLKGLTSQATGAAVTTTIGLAFGAPAFDGTCTRAPQFTINAAVIGTPYSTNGAVPFIAGSYCIVVFDGNPSTLTDIGPVNYTVEIQHY
jgi:hypothetical protein